MLNDFMEDTKKKELPDSFCSVSTMTKSIPKLLEGRHITAKLDVGDLLYLPASWFHEVISYGADGGHLALNLWMAPPHKGSTYQAPYEDGFWESFFQRLLPTARSGKVRKLRKRKLPFTHRAGARIKKSGLLAGVILC